MTQDPLSTIPPVYEFGDLRSILQNRPSDETWDLLCQFLARWNIEQVDHPHSLEYAIDIVTRWPVEQARTAPEPWVARLLMGQEVALMALANTLSLRTSNPLQPLPNTLFTSEYLANLHTLDLTGCRVGHRILALLVNCQYFTRLTSLNLDANELRDEEATLLANSPHLKNLRTLSINNNSITDEGVNELLASENFRDTELISTWGNSITPQGHAAIQAHNQRITNRT